MVPFEVTNQVWVLWEVESTVITHQLDSDLRGIIDFYGKGTLFWTFFIGWWRGIGRWAFPVETVADKMFLEFSRNVGESVTEGASVGSIWGHIVGMVSHRVLWGAFYTMAHMKMSSQALGIGEQICAMMTDDVFDLWALLGCR